MKEIKRNPNSKFYQWLDDSCEISSLTTYESNPDTQYDFIRMFIKYGYNVLNKVFPPRCMTGCHNDMYVSHY